MKLSQDSNKQLVGQIALFLRRPAQLTGKEDDLVMGGQGDKSPITAPEAAGSDY